MSESLKQKIAELNQVLAPLKKELDKLNSEAKEWAEKRNAIHRQIKKLRQEAADLKQRRDALNEQVQELKSQREKTRVKRKQKHVQIIRIG